MTNSFCKRAIIAAICLVVPIVSLVADGYEDSLLVPLGDALPAFSRGDSKALGDHLDGFAELWRDHETEGTKSSRRSTLRHIDSSITDALDRSRALFSSYRLGDHPSFRAADYPDLKQALSDLAEEVNERRSFRNGLEAADADAAKELLEALDRFAEGDLARREQALSAFGSAWSEYEGSIRSASPSAYTTIELNLAEMRTSVKNQDSVALEGNIAAVRQALTAVDASPRRAGSGAWDIAILLFREGLEAILLIGALLTMLSRADPASARRGKQWVWSGAASGVLVSVLLAVVFARVFNLVGERSGMVRESIEGWAGLVAVVLMVIVGTWLHRRSRKSAFQQSMRTRTQRAVTRGSWITFGLMAFLAVFREGAETIVFMIGIAPSLSTTGILIGCAAAAAVLAVVAVLVIGLGKRLPMKRMFLGATVLIYLLAIKVLGQSIAALQAAGALSINSVSWLPTIELLGLSPSWESFGAQLAATVLLGLLLARDRIAGALRLPRTRFGAKSSI